MKKTMTIKKIKNRKDIVHPIGGFTLLELLDRLLDKGVVVKGEIILSIAEIDLVYLNLGLLLSSVKTVEEVHQKGGNGEGRLISWATSTQGGFAKEAELQVPKVSPGPLSAIRKEESTLAISEALPSIIDGQFKSITSPKANIDPKNVEKGLAKLVLTLVDLIRKLMEKQAVRRMEGGFLSNGEIERMGTAFLLLDEKMEELKKTFALKDEDLNLDLGPLGELT